MSRYKHHIFICENQRPDEHPRGSCMHSGSGKLRTAFRKSLIERKLVSQVRANGAGCLDACEHGPAVVVYPEGIWYGNVQESDVEEIIESHIEGGVPVERLRIQDPKYTKE